MKLAGLDGLYGGNGLHPARCPQTVPDQALGGIHLDRAGVAEHFVQGSDLSHVAYLCAGGMCIDVVHLQCSSSWSHSMQRHTFPAEQHQPQCCKLCMSGVRRSGCLAMQRPISPQDWKIAVMAQCKPRKGPIAASHSLTGPCEKFLQSTQPAACCNTLHNLSWGLDTRASETVSGAKALSSHTTGNTKGI